MCVTRSLRIIVIVILIDILIVILFVVVVIVIDIIMVIVRQHFELLESILGKSRKSHHTQPQSARRVCKAMQEFDMD